MDDEDEAVEAADDESLDEAAVSLDERVNMDEDDDEVEEVIELVLDVPEHTDDALDDEAAHEDVQFGHDEDVQLVEHETMDEEHDEETEEDGESLWTCPLVSCW